MMAAAFNITPSAAFKRMSVAAMELDIVTMVQAVTVSTATEFTGKMKDSARAAGLSKKAVGAIKVGIVSNPEDLIMRQAAVPGDVTIGIDGRDPNADEADDAEWGGMGEAPKAWVRNFHALNARDINTRWSDNLTAELGRRLK